MKQQLTKIALGLAVFLIWGTVFYRIYQALVPTDDFVLGTNTFIPAKATSTSLDTFSLLANYKDPFLGKSLGRKNSSSSKERTTPRRIVPTSTPPAVSKETKLKKPVQFPAIVFKGYVENKGIKTLLLSIDGKNQYLRPGQALEGLSVARAYEDSVSLRLKGARRTFLRE